MTVITETQLLDEFTNTTNNEAYIKAFTNRVMRRDELTGYIIGNDQRKLFIPYLLEEVKNKKEILDLGAGAGEILDEIHPFVQGTTFHLEEPNLALLNEYAERLRRYNIQKGEVSSSTVQEYLKIRDRANPVDCILCIHMIYHLTDFTSENPNPEAELQDFIVKLYDLLADGSSIFLVYADLEQAYAGKVALSYFDAFGKKQHHVNLARLYRARNKVLKEQGVLKLLKSLNPQDNITMNSVVCNSQFYGDSIYDLAAMSLVGELIEANDEPFDLRKLEHALSMVLKPKDGIKIAQGADMWSANEEQVICIIKKNSTII
ncbi:hypothetical protein K493DRAFT_353025 [Basidiobolus meristosporus CBS 931.73]|uniref:S-adenosyl-L-methionine-dependent methyltransferase n=1 Tax=Basidiobolus meristosporus CBS 931.73 TaxID=1314790 RepID=A0A1Y1Y770_9FUNG|nr:hypothetical protein K493DRAFT_353025 [Basidiobolus meristosporus CBS 931.73]|eukprot:ORX93853.1 hypothetical protein K493DRAFT_353025 [Basidiobolus meristosporus CBS 931.73]